jgi:D-alanyl-lipoteichoic acid acyltransferase DltB (MBOAT superfamily)
MLLGGLWHGASCNFMIWGGLNGVGMIIFKFWSDWHTVKRIIVTSYVVCILFLLRLWASPALALWNVLLCFCVFILGSMIIKCIWQYYNSQRDYVRWPRVAKATNVAWSVIVTFTFITFTRLFFRSGSNLDPAVANETAWHIATSMMTRIGTAWTVSPLDVIPAYWKVFLLFCIGMAIHWIPERMKRRYRYSFAKMPLPIMVLVCAIAVFIIYQFVTAEMQPFIYFQF